MFPLSPLLLRLLPYGAAVVAVLAVLGWVYWQGGAAQRTKDAAASVKEITNATKQRDAVDRDINNDSDRELIERMRKDSARP